MQLAVEVMQPPCTGLGEYCELAPGFRCPLVVGRSEKEKKHLVEWCWQCWFYLTIRALSQDSCTSHSQRWCERDCGEGRSKSRLAASAAIGKHHSLVCKCRDLTRLPCCEYEEDSKFRFKWRARSVRPSSISYYSLTSTSQFKRQHFDHHQVHQL